MSNPFKKENNYNKTNILSNLLCNIYETLSKPNS